MASSRLSLIALATGAYLAFAVATFPASLAARWFAPDTISLAGVEGTVWRGSAAYGGVSGLAVADMRWRLQPLALLTGRLSFTLDTRLADGFVRTGLTVAGSRISFVDLDLAAIRSVLPSDVAPAELYGNAGVELDVLDLVDGWPVRASGTVRIADLVSSPLIAVPGVTTLAFGSFMARVSPSDGGVVAVVSDEGGPLEVAGSARLEPDRRYRIEARIKPRANAHPVTVQGLQIIDSSPVNGYHLFEREGQL
jgi:general secretion pathway protein N